MPLLAPLSHASPLALSTLPSPQYGAHLQPGPQAFIVPPYVVRLTPLSHCSPDAVCTLASPQDGGSVQSMLQVP